MRAIVLLFASALLATACAIPQGHPGAPITRTSVLELAAASEAIVVGTVQSMGGTRNMARDPADPRHADAQVVILGQDYKISAEEWIKGTGASSIVVTFARNHNPGLLARDDAEFRPLATSGRYVFFLRKQVDGTNDFVPAPEPWRFRLTDVAQAETFWDGAAHYFHAQPTGLFLSSVRAAAR